ncbi:MAG: dihydroorotate dehydrogenase electron transfer subunit [Chloroflexota bacterium]|nr:dihydroorotate dehydrogenase electron transfer subunit [Chloroflexota bacterium]MDP9472976.1 dihydroorotate dehydrogenase electron transfer subunit [Chloroflexota bacterium]
MVELDPILDMDFVGAGGVVVRAREFDSRILAVEPVMGDSAVLTLSLPPGMAGSLRAGQFVDVLCRVEGSYDPLLRRPYSIFRADPRTETMQLLVRPYGRGSAWLASRPAGTILDVLGPLGNTFQVNPRSRNLLMVAGGVGAAPLVMLTDHALADGRNVTYLMGAADADALLPASYLPSDVEYAVATDNGSKGHRGFVTDLVPEYLRWADQVFACGPEAMFRSLRAVASAHRLGGKPRIQVSVERTMACGLGACLGCVVETKHGMQTSCVQGPIYDMDEVVW